MQTDLEAADDVVCRRLVPRLISLVGRSGNPFNVSFASWTAWDLFASSYYCFKYIKIIIKYLIQS